MIITRHYIFLSILLINLFLAFNKAENVTIQCGSSNGEKCPEGYCCRKGVCFDLIKKSDVTVTENVLLVLDNSSNMKDGKMEKLNSMINDLLSKLPADVQVPYVLFADSATEAKNMASSNIPTFEIDSESTGSNFVAALESTQRFLNRWGNVKNGKHDNVVIVSGGNPILTKDDSDFGTVISKSIELVNEFKSNGVTIYTINLNDSANADAEVKSKGEIIEENDINTFMQLLSNNYDNVKITSDSNGKPKIESYNKNSSDYYRTPKGDNLDQSYEDISERVVLDIPYSTPNGKCYVNKGCETNYGEYVTVTENVLLVLDNSSNMKDGKMEKLNSMINDLLSKLPADVQVPYVLFADSATEAKNMASSNIPTFEIDSESTCSNFVAALESTQRFLNRWGNVKNGKHDNVVIVSGGNPILTKDDSDFGTVISKSIELINEFKSNGVTIYTINLNDSANADAGIKSKGEIIEENDINTFMQLLSNNYDNVKITSDSNGKAKIESYNKSSSDFYRTPKGDNLDQSYEDISERVVLDIPYSTPNGKCYVNKGCEPDYGEYVTVTENVLLVLENSSNMKDGKMEKLNSMINDLLSKLPADVQVPYVLFADSATEAKNMASSNIPTFEIDSESTGSNFVAALESTQRFLNRWGNVKNGKHDNVVIVSGGNPILTKDDSDFGTVISKSIELVNEFKSNGVTIYTINLNDSANADAEVKSKGEIIEENDINTFMQLLSNNYDDVKITSDSNGKAKIESYNKNSSDFYRTPKGDNLDQSYEDISERVVLDIPYSTPNGKCYVNKGCEPDYELNKNIYS
ncbi:hypothetical protein BCR32DRAFT_264178 [Anaeromyces robustus]|uniref:VWFA domain-containing protein n=1 Tax=Anaeromyces robustus TaxID=1754192 RepID=A0A1Y1XPA5_9FUNG|nr:hypothetical protein BCR32DRAFT_264178 [Anaeromyces robustus]|eukprot:ORX87588.1 hypothetical protein BCR32DRAFT_264178 [Anaeromyces robustus]